MWSAYLPATPNRRQSPRPSSATHSSDTRPSKMASSIKTPNEAINAALLSHFSENGTVTLLVGEDEQKMIAHSIHLTQDSEFFAAALKKEWAEGQTRIIKLPEEDTASMAHYLSYLYGGKLSTEDIKSVTGKEIYPCFDLLTCLYVCGERFLNRKIQHAVLAEILRLSSLPDKHGVQWCPAAESANIMYRGTPEDSPGRRLLVDLYVVKGERSIPGGDDGFSADVVKVLFDKVRTLKLKVKDLKIEKYC